MNLIAALVAELADAATEDRMALAQAFSDLLAPFMPPGDAAANRDDDPLMTAVEVADLLHVDPEWVRRHQETLGAYRLTDEPSSRAKSSGTNPIRYRRSRVELFLAERQLTAPGRPGRSWRDDPDWAMTP